MSLSSDQHKALFKALLDAYTIDSIERLLFFALEKDLTEITATNENKKNVFFAILKAAQKGRWLGQLLQAVKEDEDMQGNVALQQLLAELQQATNLQSIFKKNLDPFEACFLRSDGQFPLVNRHALRSTLASMLDTNGHKVLVVNGPPRSGKSYTREYIEYLSTQLRSYAFHYIDLAEEPLAALSPLDLMHSIALRMGIDRATIPPQEAQSPRWIRNLCDWLAGESAKKFEENGRTWWIVIDSISKVNLSTEMQDLIKRLVSQAEFGAQTVRVVLLDYGQLEQLPPNVQKRVGYEEIEELRRSDLRQFLQQLSEHSGVAFEDDALEEVAEWIFSEASKASDDDASFAERLAGSVEQAHSLFFLPEENAVP